jgi:hypothetical protein
MRAVSCGAGCGVDSANSDSFSVLTLCEFAAIAGGGEVSVDASARRSTRSDFGRRLLEDVVSI